MKKVMSLILEEAIMSDRHMSVGQIYSFLQLFFNTGKIRLIEQYRNRLRVAHIHHDRTLTNKDIKYEKKFSLTEYCFSFRRKLD